MKKENKWIDIEQKPHSFAIYVGKKTVKKKGRKRESEILKSKT